MTFVDRLAPIQKAFGRSGYHTCREPIDIGSISGDIIDCEIIARNDQYNILYVEAESGWKKIARHIAESQDAPCLVVTRHEKSLIMTTIKGKMVGNPALRHVVVQPDSEKYGLVVFAKKIRSTQEDDYITIDERVQKTFDDFSKYDEAIRKFGDNLGDVIKDTRDLVTKKISKNKKYNSESERFVAMCKDILNDTINQASVTDMLIQHIVTARIFAMVYDYDFYRTNAIALELERLRELLKISDDVIDYTDIKLVAESITDNKERQEFIKNIYETFYEKFDPKRANRDGIVYTPVEIIDFILNSVQHVLKTEFETDFADRNVKVLDPFTGTGTFLARLLSSGMLKDSISKKYRNDMFANEMLLLAFYIATVNIESTYVDVAKSDSYVPFEGINYTDTFMMDPRYLEGGHHRQGNTTLDKWFVDIQERRQREREANLHVIVGNPPYSVGQDNFNDQNQNVKYSNIDDRIQETYLRKLKMINPNLSAKKSIYDSYIRSIRWASDRIGDSGIVGFVTNASFIRSDAAAGMRACLEEEFTDVWVFDLRGNQRTQGEISKKEGGKIFGSGSRAPVAITILVKNPKKKEHRIHYYDVGDYHSQKKKLDFIRKFTTIHGITDWEEITPDRHHDWIDQRKNKFSEYLPIGSKTAKKGKGNAIFVLYSGGINTSRNVWVYNSSEEELSKNMKIHVEYCNKHIKKPPKPIDPSKGKWDGELSKKLQRFGKQTFSRSKIRTTLYRPFFHQYLYFDKIFNIRQYQIPKFFPQNDSENKVICIPDKGSGENFSTIMTDKTPDLHIIAQNQCFPLKVKNKDLKARESAQPVHNRTLQDTGRVLSIHNGHDSGSGGSPSRTGLPDEGDEMIDNITDHALKEYQTHYKDDKIIKEDIFYYVYGILHHSGYRSKYANNLSRELPHIPMASDFWTFSKIGKDLAGLHLSWETCKRYNLGEPKNKFGKYQKMAYAKKKIDNKMVTDKTTLKINGVIAFDNIPETKYKVNGRTPLEWAIDRYKIHTDKESGIINDATNVDIIPLIERLVYVGVESDRLVSELPEEFEPND